jgi:hypothetical protein
MRTTVRTSLYVIPNNKCSVKTRVGTCYYYKHNKTVLQPEQNIIVARTTYYYSNKFVWHLERSKIKCHNK